MLDSVGLPSTVGFTSSGTGSWFFGTTADSNPALDLLIHGYINFNEPASQQLVINGLDSAKTYDLYIASAILISSDQCSRGEWSITTNTTSTVGSQTVDNTLDENGTTWVRGNNYVLFEDVVPDGTGNITVDGFAITGDGFDIRLPVNGFQLVHVGDAPVSGYGTWATTNAGGQAPDQDYDNDGVENGIEYFMGQTGSSFTAMPGLDATNTVTWPKDPAYSGSWQVQTSSDLSNWDDVSGIEAEDGTSVSYTLPTGAGKLFVRLVVTPTL